MDVARDVRRVALIGATLAVALGAVVGHTIDVLIHKHRR